MSYILRVVIHENQWERQLEDIIWLCKYAGIEEVFVKEQCHQILMSPFPMEKHKKMATIYSEISRALKKENIIFSINIATIAGHCDCKLDAKNTLPFTHFVSDSLVENHSTYCVLDEDWQQYATEVCALYATSNPAKMMVDDDFRSINHTRYFGCFCREHVKRVAELCAMELTPQSLLNHVKGISEQDEKIRNIWKQVTFEGQLRAAKKIREAVECVNPKIRLGLMNSGERNHAVQGRDINKLIHELAGKKRALSRPLGGSYQDELHDNLIDMHQGMSLSSIQLTDTEIISEVENWPHTRFTKSITETRLQMQLHALAGANAISMNIFDFMGTPYCQEMEMVDMIRENKEKVDHIISLRRGLRQKGVGLLWDKEIAFKLKNRSGDLAGIVPPRPFDNLMPLLGICTSFEKSAVNFLCGDMVRCCSEEQLKELLAGGLILDADAVDILSQMGYAEEIGCMAGAERVEVPSAEVFTNQEFCGRFTGNMVPTNWMRLELEEVHIPSVKLLSGAFAISEILDQEYQKIAEGIVLYENRRGGRICSLPVRISDWTFAYRSRALQMVNIVRWLARGQFPVLVLDSPNVAPFYYENPENGEGILALLNTGLDDQEAHLDTKLTLTDDETGIFYLGGPVRLEPLELKLFRTSPEE